MTGSLSIDQLDDWADVFGNQVANRTNVLDIGAHYRYSPERWRLTVNGSRVFPEYGSVSQYNHAGDYHELQPAAGETVTLRTAERPRYVVQYELAATMAFALNQSLTSGDSIQVGAYDGTNGWYMEHDGSHADDEADLVLERDNTPVYRVEDRDIFAPVTDNARLKLKTGWYDITRNKWERSYTDSGAQENRTILQTSADGQRGSKTGNVPIWFSVTADAGTTGLVLEAGSCAQVNLGRTTQQKRVKIAEVVDRDVDTTGSWTPIHAIRVRPDDKIVNAQLRNFEVHEYTANDDVRVLALAHDSSKVADTNGNQLTSSDFSTPVEHSASSSVIESSSAVEQAADSSGTVTTSASDPGGYQVGLASLFTSGRGSNITAQSAASIEEKRSIHEGDIVVFWAYSGTTGDVTFDYTTEQDW